MTRATRITLMLSAGMFGTAAVHAQDYDLSWYTFDGGGAMYSVGGDFQLGGTIGQPDAGVLTGGGFELVGGFWGATGAQCDPCDMNCDGSINAFDIEPFRQLLLGGGVPCAPCSGDTTGDGSINAFDIQPFVNCLLNP